MYPDIKLFVDGAWTAAASGLTLPVHNPATGRQLGSVAHAGIVDLDNALAAAARGFEAWRATSSFERAATMRRAAMLLRERSEDVCRLMTLEQGKPLGEARMEVTRGAEVIDWLAGEAQRIYGRSIPSRMHDTTQRVVKDPIGPVAAFAPWNFPVNQIVRKVAAALAAGCSIIVKGAEETPASGAELIRAFADAGVPPGVLNLVYGTPAEISGYLIPHPIIRKVSFTGSTAVGRELAALAGRHLKVMTLELGGHAPVLIFDDADIGAAAKSLAAVKFRNAGQTCLSPTRILVQNAAYEAFSERFIAAARALKVGDGLQPDVQMGPLANPRRLTAIEGFIDDAVRQGARLRLGGHRIARDGYFFEPTILSDVPLGARAMNEEPFGPLALLRPFSTLEEGIAEANRLRYGLSAYVFTGSSRTANACAARIESGMIAINGFGLGHPETPFGGMKDSGNGVEGGSEAIEAYLQTRFISSNL